MKTLLFLFTPLMVFANLTEEIHFEEKAYIFEGPDRIYLKTGPAATIYNKTRVRPAVGIGYRTERYKDHFFNTLDITFSYSYNNLEKPKRAYSIGEIFFPKCSALHYCSPEEEQSLFYGLGGGIYSSWQKEVHANSPSLLSTGDDNIYNVRSYSFLGTAIGLTIGYELNRFKEISSGLQLELNTPFVPLSFNNTGKPSPLTIEINYISGF